MEKEGQATIKVRGEHASPFKSMLTFPDRYVDKKNEESLSKFERE